MKDILKNLEGTWKTLFYLDVALVLAALLILSNFVIQTEHVVFGVLENFLGGLLIVFTPLSVVFSIILVVKDPPTGSPYKWILLAIPLLLLLSFVLF